VLREEHDALAKTPQACADQFTAWIITSSDNQRVAHHPSKRLRPRSSMCQNLEKLPLIIQKPNLVVLNKQIVDERGIKPSNETSGRFTSLHAVYIFHGSCRFPVLKFIGLSHISVLLFDWWWT
jgi:hypothetical protein